MFVAVLEFPADPGEAVPAPHSSIVCFTEPIDPASSFEPASDVFRRVMRFADDENHFPRGLKSRDFTTNLWSPQSSTKSVTFAIWLSTMASCSRSDVAHLSTVPGLSSRAPE